MKRSIAVLLIFMCLFTANIGSAAFAKEGDFTRGSFCARIVEELNLNADISGMRNFVDVDTSNEYYRQIMIMCKLGHMNGFEDGTFKPDNSITRAEAAKVIIAMIFDSGFDMPKNPSYPSDFSETDWYSRYAWKAIDSKIMSLTDNKFNGLRVLSEDDIDFAKIKSYAGIIVMVDGNKVIFDVQPQIIDGRTMVPVRGIFEALNAIVDWDGSTQTVIAKKDNTIIRITINQKSFTKNNESKKLDVPAQIINGRTLVPVRAIGESFDCTVLWDDSDILKKVIINSNKTEETPTRQEEEKTNVEETKEDEIVVVQPDENEDSTELSCSAKVSHSCISIGGKYRIVYAITVEGKGGKGNYKYKYEIYQNEKITKKSSYGKENKYEGQITGIGSCIFKVYVKDGNGNEVSKELILNE